MLFLLVGFRVVFAPLRGAEFILFETAVRMDLSLGLGDIVSSSRGTLWKS
jgi:hypothetical protein